MKERTGTSRGRVAAVFVGLGVIVSALAIASPSNASFPGTNGLIAYVDNTIVGGNVFVVNPSNPVPMQITNTGNYKSVAYNASGNRLAASTTAGLVLLDPVAGSSVTPIPNTTPGDQSPTFDPTGDKVAFAVGVTTLATISTSGADRTVIETATAAFSPEWSPDGSFIVFGRLDGGIGHIARVSPTGGTRVVLTPAGTCVGVCRTATVSPDGKRVAFENLPTIGIRQVNADGSSAAAQLLTNDIGDNTPSYSPDGSQIAFLRGNAPGDLHRVPSDGSGTATRIGTIRSTAALTFRGVSWGPAAGGGTGTGTGTGTSGSVISVAAVRNGANCVFNITANPAADGTTVDFSITNEKGKEKLAGNDVTVPASPSIKGQRQRRNGKTKKLVRSITLSDPKGATIGSGSATCAK